MVFSRCRFVAALLALGPLAAAAPAAIRVPPTRPAAASETTAYRGAIVIDATTGGVLFEDRADTVGAPASMVKLMTFAVLHDLLASGAVTLATPIRITVADARMGGTQVYLDPRETFSVEELLHGMMVQSANDAAHALARATAGSIEGFVALMNAKARELGMTRTTFRTAHGLPPASRKIEDGDLTTPRDFALLSRHLLRHTNVTEYSSIRLRQFGAGSRKQPMDMVNHNRLLGKVEGVDGLKTGFTRGAGFCLAATAERGGRRLIVVTMGSPDARTRDLKVTELFARGFALLPPGPVSGNNAGSPVRPGHRSPIIPAPAPAAEPTIRFSIPPR